MEKFEHRQHNLRRLKNLDGRFICDVCSYVSYAFINYCSDCGLYVCSDCVSINREFIPNLQNTKTYHFSHKHELTICKYKESYTYDCMLCDRELSGLSYGCLDCDFFFHESCKDIPQTIHHPIAHPLHPLRRTDFTMDQNVSRRRRVCKACGINIDGVPFGCRECDFDLHVQCAYSLMSALRHECHPHPLLYMASEEIEYVDYAFPCDVCGAFDCRMDGGDGNFYRCVQCDLNFHFKCVSIPENIKHRNHLHSLTLMDSFVDDEKEKSNKYGYVRPNCDICETERNPKHHLYACTECSFTAHIQCALSDQEQSEILFNLIPYHEKDGTSLQDQNKIMIQPAIHHHDLYSVEVNDTKYYNCVMCHLRIIDGAYVCTRCKFWVHKSCAELPTEMQIIHPLHLNCTQSLTLFSKSPHHVNPFICQNCRHIYNGFNYHCRDCSFTLDVNCASKPPNDTTTPNQSQDHGLVVKTKRETNISHFTHHHDLALAYWPNHLDSPWLTSKLDHTIICSVCMHFVTEEKSCYCCLECHFFVHETCLEYPKEMKHPFHLPHHPLRLKHTYDNKCDACGLVGDQTLKYCCEECDVFLHVECANFLEFSLKHKHHEHDLYYYHKRFQNYFFIFMVDFYCDVCSQVCMGSFYRCVECKLNFHLECLPLPRIVKHKRHWHPLTLMDSVVEDNSGEYYCEVCERLRNPTHHVYYCEECTFVAHVECILSDENTSSGVELELIEDENDGEDKEVEGELEKLRIQ